MNKKPERERVLMVTVSGTWPNQKINLRYFKTEQVALRRHPYIKTWNRIHFEDYDQVRFYSPGSEKYYGKRKLNDEIITGKVKYENY